MYTLHVYTKMKEDLFNTTIVCDRCNVKTRKSETDRHGFSIRIWQCPKCNNLWEHPSDVQEYENFEKIKNKTFQVKLRLVGNSYAVSIPREIIEFEEELRREINEIINMSLESPDKLSIFFSKKIRKLY